jgi:stage V sporulation protein AA
MKRYIWLKEEAALAEGAHVQLEQIARLYPFDRKIAQTPITPHSMDNGMRWVVQIDVAEALGNRSEDEVTFLGAPCCWITEPVRMPNRGARYVVAVIVTSILIFFAAFFTIMNFHADVDMIAVHEKLLLIFTGDTQDAQLWVGIPYSIGVALGALLFVIPCGKQRHVPDPMQVQNAIYENEVKTYMRAGKGRKS